MMHESRPKQQQLGNFHRPTAIHTAPYFTAEDDEDVVGMPVHELLEEALEATGLYTL
jgi:hypothetical protein